MGPLIQMVTATADTSANTLSSADITNITNLATAILNFATGGKLTWIAGGVVLLMLAAAYIWWSGVKKKAAEAAAERKKTDEIAANPIVNQKPSDDFQESGHIIDENRSTEPKESRPEEPN